MPSGALSWPEKQRTIPFNPERTCSQIRDGGGLVGGVRVGNGDCGGGGEQAQKRGVGQGFRAFRLHPADIFQVSEIRGRTDVAAICDLV